MLDVLENNLPQAIARGLWWQLRSYEPARYYRQYAGFFRNARPVVYINALDETWIQLRAHDTGVDSWRDRAVTICDGGTSVFGAVFDPATKLFDSFEVNGSM